MDQPTRELAETTQTDLDHVLPYDAQQKQREKALTDLCRQFAAACLLYLRCCSRSPCRGQKTTENRDFGELIASVLSQIDIEEEHRKALVDALKQLSPDDAVRPREIVKKLSLMDDTSPMSQLHEKIYLLLRQNETAARAYTYITL